MNPESLMPAFRNGLAGFLIAITSVIVPLTAVTYENRPSPVREASSSRNFVKDTRHSFQRRVGNVHGATYSLDYKAYALHKYDEAYAS